MSGLIFFKNSEAKTQVSLPEGSIYGPAREAVEKTMRGEALKGTAVPAEPWAGLVVRDLLKRRPPPVVWRGTQAWYVWLGTFLPFGMLDGMTKKMTGVDVVEKMVRE